LPLRREGGAAWPRAMGGSCSSQCGRRFAHVCHPADAARLHREAEEYAASMPPAEILSEVQPSELTDRTRWLTAPPPVPTSRGTPLEATVPVDRRIPLYPEGLEQHQRLLSANWCVKTSCPAMIAVMSGLLFASLAVIVLVLPALTPHTSTTTMTTSTATTTTATTTSTSSTITTTSTSERTTGIATTNHVRASAVASSTTAYTSTTQQAERSKRAFGTTEAVTTSHKATTTPMPTEPALAEVLISLTLQHLDYSRLMAIPNLQGAVEKKLCGTIASEAGHSVSPDAVQIALAAGSVMVKARIDKLGADVADAVQSELNASKFSQSVAARVGEVHNIGAVVTGPISVSDVDVSTRTATAKASGLGPQVLRATVAVTLIFAAIGCLMLLLGCLLGRRPRSDGYSLTSNEENPMPKFPDGPRGPAYPSAPMPPSTSRRRTAPVRAQVASSSEPALPPLIEDQEAEEQTSARGVVPAAMRFAPAPAPATAPTPAPRPAQVSAPVAVATPPPEAPPASTSGPGTPSEVASPEATAAEAPEVVVGTPGRGGGQGSSADAAFVAMVADMGFSEDQARRALAEANGDTEVALDRLLTAP